MASLRRAPFFVSTAAFALALTACPADDTSEETTAGTTAATSGGSTSGGSTSDASTSTTTDSSTTDPSTTTDPSATGTSDSSTGDCPVGTEGCPCDEGACDGALECLSEVCAAAGACETDIDAEPNDDEGSADDIGDVDCDLVQEVTGNVSTADIDWFTFHGLDDDACADDSIAIVEADVDLEVCMYFDCDMGNPQVVCPNDATQIASPGGVAGCCRTNDVEFMTQSCLGAATGDNGTVFLTVSGSEEQACVDYALAYRFF